MSGRLFVSSTVYDLIDIRHEVESLIREMGMTPVMSGSSTADFHKPPDQNTIETCLTNLRSCDAALVILDQRYGPSLKPAGFDDKSATHLEYLEARGHSIPIYVYVRDRLEADYNIWRKNKAAPDLSLLWVPETQDRRLFEVIDEHKKLVAGDSRNNWYETFRNSGELKGVIRRDFRFRSGRIELERLIDANQIPMLEMKVEATPVAQRMGSDFYVKMTLKNLGGSAAYNINWNWKLRGNELTGHCPELAPNQKTIQCLTVNLTLVVAGLDDDVDVEYYTAKGHRIIDRYKAGVQLLDGGIVHGATFVRRQYEVGDSNTRPFTIADAQKDK